MPGSSVQHAQQRAVDAQSHQERAALGGAVLAMEGAVTRRVSHLLERAHRAQREGDLVEDRGLAAIWVAILHGPDIPHLLGDPRGGVELPVPALVAAPQA